MHDLKHINKGCCNSNNSVFVSNQYSYEISDILKYMDHLLYHQNLNDLLLKEIQSRIDNTNNISKEFDDFKNKISQNTNNVKLFGAKGDGKTDDTAAIQAAIDAGVKLQFEANAKYKITTPLIIRHGTINGKTYNNLIDFNYCQIIPYFDDYAIKIESVGSLTEPTTNLAYFDLRNLTINLGANGNAKALKIGGKEQMIDSFHYSTITNFMVESSTGHGTVTTIEHARHLRFVGVVHRHCGVELLARRAGAFCGDIEFLTCEFAGNGASRPLYMRAGDYNVYETASLRGITFDNCDIYGSETVLESIVKGDLGDIWFDKVQWDAPPLARNGEAAVRINVTDSARIFQIHISNCYFVGYNGFAAVLTRDNSTATATQVEFSSCHFNNIDASAINGKSIIYLGKFQGVAFSNCEFVDITGGGIFNFDNVNNFKVLGCKTMRCTNTEFLAYVGGNSNNYIIANNMADTSNQNPINDYSGSSQKIVKDNLKA